MGMEEKIHMNLLEELTEKYSVLDVPSYGKCVIIPAKDFHSDLEKMLRERGVRTFRSHMGGPVIQIPLDDLKNTKVATSQPSEGQISPAVIAAIKSPPKPKVLHGPSWNAKEDELLIALRLSGLTEEAAAAEFVKHFPNRTPGAVHNRVNRLIKHGKIEARYGGPKKRKKQKLEIREAPPPKEPEPATPEPEEEKSESFPQPVRTQPLDIKTTLTLNITVDCSDRSAVANFLEIVKELGGVTKKEASS
jgi:hypothetical protein